MRPFSRIRRKRYNDHYARFILFDLSRKLPILLSFSFLSFERAAEKDYLSLFGLFHGVRGIFDPDRSHPPSGGSGFARVGTFGLECNRGQALPSTGPSGSGSSSMWEEDSFELGVLEESDSPRQGVPNGRGEPSVNQGSPLPSQTEEGEPSVNQVPQEAGPALPANPVPPGGGSWASSPLSIQEG